MKSIFPVLICFSLLCACKQEKSAQESNQQKFTKKITDSIVPVIFKTSTGKSIQLINEPESSSLSNLKIVALDFENSKDTFSIQDADPLQHSWIKDLDQNGYDELYLITTSAGSGSYATIYGYASNQDLSLTPIYIPEISEKELLPEGSFYGYRGHDSIFQVKNKILRKYPVYRDGDPNCCPSGGYRTLNYYLKAGEASWILEIKN